MSMGTILGLAGLAVAVALAVRWFKHIKDVDLPEDRTTFVVGFLVAACMGISALVAGPGWIGGIAAVSAIIVGLFFPFSVSISRQELATDAIKVGDAIPQFAALDENRETFDSESLHGHLVLIKFFRAHW